MLADFDLAGGRSTRLTQLASPRFEEKEALSARQMEDGKLLDHPQLGGDFRPSGKNGRLFSRKMLGSKFLRATASIQACRRPP